MKVAILGGGAMATACAILIAEHSGQRACIWARNSDVARDIQQNRENRRLLPGVALPETVAVTSDIGEAVAEASVLVVSIPTAYLRQALAGIAAAVKDQRPVVSVVKGLENDTFMRPSEIVLEVLGHRKIVALCGPSHAEEIARKMPASVVAAGEDLTLARQVQQMFNTDRFRVYTNQDIVGVELAGALKNVVAIAAGISDGLGYGDNAKAALMTRGIAEMTRFGTALGAQPSTFTGLAGMGDLITTCTSNHSRNRYVGEQLGRGAALDDILGSMQSVAEGVATARSIYELASRRDLDVPIITEVYRVLFESKPPLEATCSLMNRPPRHE